MRKISLAILFVLGVILTAGGSVSVLAADTPPLMTIETLKETLQEPGMVILDVRRGKDWTSSQHKIPGAVYSDPGEYEKLTQTYAKDTKIVAYCAWPNEYTSASLARKLIKDGYTNVYALKGGWRAWQRADYPVVDKE